MKHLIFSLVLLAMLLSVCFGATAYITNRIVLTETQLQQALLRYEEQQKADAEAIIRNAAQSWQTYSNVFGAILRHDGIDHVNGEFARLLSYVNSSDQDDFRSTCAALLSDLAHIREMEQPIWPNIL